MLIQTSEWRSFDTLPSHCFRLILISPSSNLSIEVSNGVFVLEGIYKWWWWSISSCSQNSPFKDKFAAQNEQNRMKTEKLRRRTMKSGEKGRGLPSCFPSFPNAMFWISPSIVVFALESPYWANWASFASFHDIIWPQLHSYLLTLSSLS